MALQYNKNEAYTQSGDIWYRVSPGGNYTVTKSEIGGENSRARENGIAEAISMMKFSTQGIPLDDVIVWLANFYSGLHVTF